MNLDSIVKGCESLFFSLTRGTLSHPAPERKQLLFNLCCESYWETDVPVVGLRPSFEELFPFAQLEESVQDSYLQPYMIQRVVAWIRELKSAVERLYISSQSAPEEETISGVLMAYYKLYRGVLKDSDILVKGLNILKEHQGGEGQGYVFLRTLLNLGCCFRQVDEAGHIVGIVTPFAPRYLSAISETASLLTELDETRARQRNEAEIEVLNTFVSRMLRWYLVAPDGTLCHAAARPVTSIPQERSDICMMIRPLADYSSYEGINELRIFEKIRYEMERKAEKNGNLPDSFSILIAGDIDANQIIKLGWMLEGWLGRSSIWPVHQDARITFSLFTDNCSFDLPSAVGWEDRLKEFRWLRMGYHSIGELFESPRSLKRQVDGADFLLFMDCRQMYEDIHTLPCPDLSAFFQQTSEFTIDAIRQSASGHVLSPNSPFLQTQNLLLGILYGRGGPALLKKEVSTAWLNHIGALLKPQEKIAYFYYSDLDAAQDLYWQEDYFVRVEDYAGKRMVILRYSESEDRKLETNQEKVIVFNLWQFIRHCNLHRIDKLMKWFGLDGESEIDCAKNISLLSTVLIGINYADWPNCLHLSCAYPNDEVAFCNGVFEERLREYINNIVLPCFGQKEKSIYLSYFRKCIASFLYSGASSVSDMLFIHIFKRHFSLLRNVFLQWEEDYSKLACFQIARRKYSGKRFYQEVMRDYDEPTCYVADRNRKLILMKKSGDLRPEDVFRNIQRACEENQYSNSNLYRNCSKWLKNNNHIL